MKKPFLSLSLDTARESFAELGAAPMHANRLRRNLLLTGDARHPSARSRPFPKGLWKELEERFCWLSLESAYRTSAADGSEKHLLKLADGKTVEAVRLPGKQAPSACLSTQVGCAVACKFCASGLEGVQRNLTGYEILEQVALLRRFGPVRRLVFMGAGEPTHNLQALKDALPVLRDEAELGPRNVLVSTVGPPSAIDRIAALGLKLTLALSLHTLDQDLRSELIPTQAKVNPYELLEAADRYRVSTGRSYQVEYVLLGGINDSRADARQLARAMKGRRGHLSLIAWNPVSGMPFTTPNQESVRAFVEVLHAEKISCTLRNTVGGDAAAACGQLRANLAV